jgi:hypothetical protein
MPMAEHKLAILVSAVGAAKAAKDLKGVDAAISGIGARAGRGLRTAASNMLKLGAAGAAVGAGLVAVNVKSGIQSLATLESAVASVSGAIETMGLAGQLSGAQVATWANEIEGAVGAAFDDKDITAATANLIRYGKVSPKALRPAMVVMTDLAAKTGSVESASTLLGKALADPAKASGKLARAGIILTKQQQKQITAMVKAGRTAEAQGMLLEIIAQQTKGAAEASQGPYARAMSTMSDATEDAQRALAVGFLPVIQRASEWIKGKLADPATLSQIEGFGKSLAGAFDEAITFAQKIPWQAIGDGLKTAADWAGRLFDAFRSMPPEAQATILALAGLDKLSGGAISGIVGELGKGLVKGVLGMTAGVVNINAGVVNGPGGVPGVPGATGGKGGKVGDLVKDAGRLIPGIGTGLIMGQQMNQQAGASGQGGDTWTKKLADEWFRGGKTSDTTKAVAEVGQKQTESVVAFRASERAASTGLSNVSNTTRTGAAMTAMAQATAAARIVAAISAARTVVNVSVNVPGANVRYGSSTGSAGSGSGSARTARPD